MGLIIRRHNYYRKFRKTVKISRTNSRVNGARDGMIYSAAGNTSGIRGLRISFLVLLSAPLSLYSYVGAYCVTARRLLSIEFTIKHARGRRPEMHRSRLQDT